MALRSAIAPAAWFRELFRSACGLRLVRPIKIPLPQHPRAEGGRDELDVTAVGSRLDDDFRLHGLSTYELPLMAALLTVASDLAGAVVVDVADDARLAGIVCAALLPDVEVHALCSSDRTSSSLSAVAEDNDLAMRIHRYDPSEPRIADQLVDLSVVARVIVVDMENSLDAMKSAQQAVRDHRPFVFVPVRGAEGGLSVGTTEMMLRANYVGYRLSPSTTFRPRRRWRNPSGSANPYWMLCPDPVDEGFIDRFDWWFEELAAAAPVSSAQMSITDRVRAEQRSGGFRPAITAALSSTLGHVKALTWRPTGDRRPTGTRWRESR